MRWLTVIIVTACCTSCQHPATGTGSTMPAERDDHESMELRPCDFEGVAYHFYTTKGAVRRAPRWAATADCAPLPPRKAHAAALAVARAIRPDVSDWYTEAISLEPWGGELDWIYTVRFTRADIPMTGQPSVLEVPVLMDGTAPRTTSHRAGTQ
jgi:hypothetical protein